MRSFHPEEYATFFPDKPDAKVRHTATGLAALEGTAGTDLEAEMEAEMEAAVSIQVELQGRGFSPQPLTLCLNMRVSGCSVLIV